MIPVSQTRKEVYRAGIDIFYLHSIHRPVSALISGFAFLVTFCILQGIASPALPSVTIGVVYAGVEVIKWFELPTLPAGLARIIGFS